VVPLVALALIGLLVLVAFAMALTFSLAHLFLTLAVAGLVGWLADLAVPGELPYGWLGAVTAGLIGGWVGTMLLGPVGPALFGVRILPAFVGAALLAFLLELVGKSAASRR
jgi:uncharacterized membrane protein YeaQ/YmgE (transglycosylase-associated protein family)